MLWNDLVVVIIYLDVTSLTNWDIDGILCPKCSSNFLLSNSEQKSLEFHPSWSFLGHSLELSMFATLSMAYKVLLIVPIYLPNWLLVFTT
jgi:hypothetical protein